MSYGMLNFVCAVIWVTLALGTGGGLGYLVYRIVNKPAKRVAEDVVDAEYELSARDQFYNSIIDAMQLAGNDRVTFSTEYDMLYMNDGTRALSIKADEEVKNIVFHGTAPGMDAWAWLDKELNIVHGELNGMSFPDCTVEQFFADMKAGILWSTVCE